VKGTALILAILLVGVCALPAQISSHYAFSATTETYSAIAGTSIPTAVGDNVISNPVDIGFAFHYGTNTYTQVKVSSNGYVTLGTVPGSSAINLLTSTTICPVLAPLWDDTYLQGSAQYLLAGASPNRVFTVQFAGVKWPTGSVTSFNYQVRLHEDGTIAFIYGNGVGNPTNASASIGINMLPGGYENYYSVTPGNPATASNTVENPSVNVWPGNGTKYVFSVPDLFTNDLAALSLTGNQTPTAGISYNYTVAVNNNGTATQTNYSVKLMAGTTQLASVAGPTIAPQATLNVMIPWTPAEAGSTIISGEVDLTGDEDPGNDLTPPLELVVQAAGTAALTIGDGSESARKPVDMSYLNSMFETIFPASEITLNGTITGVSFYNNFFDHCPNKPTKIWLGTTTQTNLSAGWIPAYQLTQVFNGNVHYPHGQNIIHIAFNPANPFVYSGGNLVMLVNRPLDTAYYNSANYFQCQTVATNRSRNAYSDATVYDPNNMGTLGTVSGQFPKTTFYLLPGAVDPDFSVEPASCNFGQVLLNHTVTQQFSVYNSGGGTLNVSGIAISGSPHFSLGGLPTLPVALGSGQSLSFTAHYLPTAAGAHTATVNITDDLARLVHPVPLSGTGIDPTVNTLPYNQNFDMVTAPSLPFDWQKITLGSATVTTVTTSPYSAPNCVLMNNSTSSQGPYLIAPPVSASFPVNQLRVRFRAKGASGFSLNVGVMTNPLDQATFTAVRSITLSNEWAEYLADLRIYQGTGTFIAFRHNQGGNNRSIYLDNVVVEQILQDDLAALQITGVTTPNAGTAYNYSITIYNWGLNNQNEYQVKLFKQGGIELASTPGPTIAGNTQAVVTIPWTPTTMENTYLYGRVVLAGDQNPGNDQTPNLPITVQESETTLVVIGSGIDFNHEAPINLYTNASLYENIYRQDELMYSGLISIVNFYNFFTSIMPPKHVRMWLGSTTLAHLDSGWIPASELTLVFDGELSFPTGVNTIPIVLQQPFTLPQGHNLVMMVQRPYDENTYNFWDSFLCQYDTANRVRRIGSSQELDPNDPPTGEYVTQFPKTGFYITPGGAGNLAGTVYGADNQPLPNATVRMTNGPQATTDATGQYLIQSVFAMDYAVTAGAHGYNDLVQYITVEEDSTVTLNFTLAPTPTVSVTGTVSGSDDPAGGIAGAQITLTGYDDYQAVTDASGQFAITGVYTGHTYGYEVSAPGYESVSGTLEIGSTDYDLGNIVLNELTYPPTNVLASIISNHTEVDVHWLAPDLGNTGRTLVGYKVWRLLQGQEQNETAWTLLTPEAITLQRYVDTQWPSLPQGFFKWAVKSVYTNNVLSTPALSNALQTTGKLMGIVRNAQQEPIAGATVTTGSHTATTAADGSYALYLPGGTYSVTCTYQGYYVSTQFNVVIEVGQTTQLDFIMVVVGNEDNVQIAATKLHANYPNPFNPSTTILYDLKDPSPVRLEIYNLKGQLVRRLVHEAKAPGHYQVVWDGRDDNDAEVGSGVYQYLLSAGSYRKSCRMTLKK
jgi:hypothetical protein